MGGGGAEQNILEQKQNQVNSLNLEKFTKNHGRYTYSYNVYNSYYFCLKKKVMLTILNGIYSFKTQRFTDYSKVFIIEQSHIEFALPNNHSIHRNLK